MVYYRYFGFILFFLRRKEIHSFHILTCRWSDTVWYQATDDTCRALMLMTYYFFWLSDVYLGATKDLGVQFTKIQWHGRTENYPVSLKFQPCNKSIQAALTPSKATRLNSATVKPTILRRRMGIYRVQNWLMEKNYQLSFETSGCDLYAKKSTTNTRSVWSC